MRIRTIKPEFFKHEQLFDLEEKTGLPIRVAFSGLWCAADREGRFKWRPRSLKVDILPFDRCGFDQVLTALADSGMVVKYSDGVEEFGYIPNFSEHQRPNTREARSKIPAPEKCTCMHVQGSAKNCTREILDLQPSSTLANLDQGEGKGKERKGREQGREGNTTDTNEISITEQLESTAFSAFGSVPLANLIEWRKGHGEHWIIKAIAKAEASGKCKVPYVAAILAGWAKEGYPEEKENTRGGGSSRHFEASDGSKFDGVGDRMEV